MGKKKASKRTPKRPEPRPTPQAALDRALAEAPEDPAADVAAPPEWERREDIEKLVAELVEKWHGHLARARIIVLGKPKASKVGGKVNVAKAKRATPAIQALLKDASGLDVAYLIEVGVDAWEALSAKQKRATLDHELMHFTGADEKGRWGLQGHDVQAFTAEIRRHGAWHSDLAAFCDEARQLKLPGVE